MKSQPAILSRFLLVFTAISSLFIGYLYYRYVREIGAGTPLKRGIVAFLVFSLIGLLLTPMLIRSGLIEFRSFAAVIGFHAIYLSMGFLAGLLIYSWLVEPIHWSFATVHDPERRKFFSRALKIGTLGVAVASTSIGFIQAKMRPRIRKIEIRLGNLPPEFEGYSIAHVSDLHIGPTIDRNEVLKLVAEVNALQADAVAITGDLVDGSVDLLRDAVEPLRNLQSKDGTFYCNGNHEFFYDVESWMSHLKTLGFQALANEHRVISRGSAQIVIGGIHDVESHRFGPGFESDPKKAILGAPEKAPKILLAHQPKSCDAALEAGWDAQLSGHTHAGQFFPFSLLVRFAHRYVEGLHLHGGKMWIFVNNGTGYWGPPVRTAKPREVALITFKKA